MLIIDLNEKKLILSKLTYWYLGCVLQMCSPVELHQQCQAYRGGWKHTVGNISLLFLEGSALQNWMWRIPRGNGSFGWSSWWWQGNFCLLLFTILLNHNFLHNRQEMIQAIISFSKKREKSDIDFSIHDLLFVYI